MSWKKSTGLRYQGGTRYVWQNITGQLRCCRCVPQRWQTEKEREELPLTQWQGKNIDSVLREEGQEECMTERETVVTSERVMSTFVTHTWFMPRISPPERCHNMLVFSTHTCGVMASFTGNICMSVFRRHLDFPCTIISKITGRSWFKIRTIWACSYREFLLMIKLKRQH